MNIVLTRLDRVGDLLLSTPAIASVRRSWPGAHVTLVCSRYNAVVVRHNLDIDALLALSEDDAPAAVGRRYRGACDIAIALAPRVADFQLVGATRGRVRVGYTYVRRYVARFTAGLYLTRLGISEADPELCERHPARVVRHEVEQVLDLVRLAGGTQLVRELVVTIDEADRAAVREVASDAITLQLGERWFRDGSTYASMVALVRDLRAFGLPVIVTYGTDAIEEAVALRAEGVADAVIGGLSFGQWAAVFEKSRVVVTVDTGATHLASAMRRPTVVLFEHRYFHLSSQEWSPYRVPSACVRKPGSEAATALAASRAALVGAVGELLHASIVAPDRV